jgi:hypothetical protein
MDPCLPGEQADFALGSLLTQLMATTVPNLEGTGWIGLFPALLIERLLGQATQAEPSNMFQLKVRYNIRCSICSTPVSIVAEHDWLCAMMQNREIRKHRGITVQILPAAALEQKAADLDKGLSHPWFEFSQEPTLKCSCEQRVRLIDRFVVEDMSHCIWIQVEQTDSDQVCF